MSESSETYVRRQGQGKTYDIEYTALRYRISTGGKLLKQVTLPVNAIGPNGREDCWKSAVADIEYLRGMPEA